MTPRRRSQRLLPLLAVVGVLLVALVGAAPDASAASKSSSCQKMSGQVLMTYHNPDTIILARARA